MAGHRHVMALALKKLHPDWQIKAHVGWDEESEDDLDYRIDHVFIVAPDGSAYDCRGRFNNEEELIGSHETGGVETQVVDYDFEDIRRDVTRGELKKFTKQDLENAMKFAGNVLTEEAWLDHFFGLKINPLIIFLILLPLFSALISGCFLATVIFLRLRSERVTPKDIVTGKQIGRAHV